MMGNERDSGPGTEAKGIPILLVREMEKGPMTETKEDQKDTGPRRIACCSLLFSLQNLPRKPSGCLAPPK